MMAVILFLFLTLGSGAAFAGEQLLPALTMPTANFDQPLLNARSDLSRRDIKLYRGGAEGLIHNTVSVSTQTSLGAGVVLSDESASQLLPSIPSSVMAEYSFIVSNFHVVSDGIDPVISFAPKGRMSIDDAEMVQGEVIAIVPSKDLALITVSRRPDHVSGVTLSEFESIQIGDDVEAVGHPLGELWTYTRGYVSQIRQGYSWSYNDSYELSADVIQTQTPISTGNSGGPLFSRSGELIGINSFGSDSGQNINFAVAITELPTLAEAFDKSLEVNEVSQSLNWDELPQLLGNSYTLIEKGETEDKELLFQLYELKSDDEIAVAAFFDGEDSKPLLVYEQVIDDLPLTFLLDADHDNPGAYFYVEIVDEDGETVATGWDFDGDFVVDYLR